jgi:hypothetical protein
MKCVYGVPAAARNCGSAAGILGSALMDGEGGKKALYPAVTGGEPARNESNESMFAIVAPSMQAAAGSHRGPSLISTPSIPYRSRLTGKGRASGTAAGRSGLT